MLIQKRVVYTNLHIYVFFLLINKENYQRNNFENFVNFCVDFDNALLVKILILYYSYIIICISIITDFPFDIDESILSTELEAIPGMGIVGIKRYGDCARFHYTITYLTLPGDVEQIQASKIILKRTRLLVDNDLFLNPYTMHLFIHNIFKIKFKFPIFHAKKSISIKLINMYDTPII